MSKLGESIYILCKRHPFDISVSLPYENVICYAPMEHYLQVEARKIIFGREDGFPSSSSSSSCGMKESRVSEQTNKRVNTSH